jgi:hypothetical protein
VRCFVIMPFGDPDVDPAYAAQQEDLYRWIKSTAESLDSGGARVECHRADKEIGPGEIIPRVIEHLIDDDIVIADLSRKNANVFYELGVRHALRYNTILIAQDRGDVPFDLRSLRVIFYKYEAGHLLDFVNALRQALEKVLGKSGEPDNPVKRLIDRRERERGTREAADLAAAAMAAEVAALKKELQSFRSYFDELRDLTQSITSIERGTATAAEEAADLRQFEGVWTRKDGTTHCMRVVRGQLAVAYCYMGDTHLTGHFLNCRVIGATLFARFEWFSRPVSGLIFFRKKSRNLMSGGWWYSHDVPADLLRDFSKLDETVPGMVPMDARRKSSTVQFPPWAELYFREAESGEISWEFRRLVKRANMPYYT